MENTFFKTNLIERLKLHGSAEKLAVFRILLGSIILITSLETTFLYIYEMGDLGKKVTFFPKFIDNFTVDYLLELNTIVIIGSIFFILGIFFKYTAPLFMIAYILMYNGAYTAQFIHNYWPYFWFTLVIISFSHAADKFSVDSFINRNKKEKNALSYRWPIESIKLWFGLIYFWAGLAKITPLHNAYFWIQGGTIKNIFIERFQISPVYYIFGQPVFNYVEDYQWIYLFFGISTVLLELSGILLLLTSKLDKYIIPCLIIFHFTITLSGIGPALFLASLILSFVFIDEKYFKFLKI
jgi:hypothetical protein